MGGIIGWKSEIINVTLIVVVLEILKYNASEFELCIYLKMWRDCCIFFLYEISVLCLCVWCILICNYLTPQLYFIVKLLKNFQFLYQKNSLSHLLFCNGTMEIINDGITTTNSMMNQNNLNNNKVVTHSYKIIQSCIYLQNQLFISH